MNLRKIRRIAQSCASLPIVSSREVNLAAKNNANWPAVPRRGRRMQARYVWFRARCDSTALPRTQPSWPEYWREVNDNKGVLYV